MQFAVPGFPGRIVTVSLIAPARINPAGQASSPPSFSLTDGLIFLGIGIAGYWAYTVYRDEEQRALRHFREKRPYGYQTHVPPAPRRR